MIDSSNFSLSPDQLENAVALALGQPTTQLGEVQIKQLGGGLEVNNRLYQISGQAYTTTGVTPWSLVIKTVQQAPATDSTPQAVRYWKREALFYQSGLIDNISCTLVPPRCYQVTQAGEVTLIWMEAIKEDLPKPWPREHYAEVARRLGCFNGTFLSGMPQAPWLAQHWLRGYTEIGAHVMDNLPEFRQLPLFQATYPDMPDDFLLEAWGRKGEFFDLLESMPQTLCHQDAFESNLFWRCDPNGQGQLVGLDWAFVGHASLGEELSALVYMASGLSAEEKLQLFETCLQGYLTGLAEAGWTGDSRLVRFSGLVALFYRYFFGAMGELWLYARHEQNYPLIAASFGVPSIDYVIGHYRAHNPFHKEIYSQLCKLKAELFAIFE